MPLPVNVRRHAWHDIEAAAVYYLAEAGVGVTRRFITSVFDAFERLGEHPRMGSSRWSHELGVPDLRSWPLQHFPYTVFYVPGIDVIEIARVLHSKRDVPAAFASLG